MGAGNGRLAGNVGRGSGDMQQGQADIECRIGVARIVDRDDRSVPDGAQRAAVSNGDKDRQVEGGAMVPAFGDHFRPDSGWIAEGNGYRSNWSGDHPPPSSVLT